MKTFCMLLILVLINEHACRDLLAESSSTKELLKRLLEDEIKRAENPTDMPAMTPNPTQEPGEPKTTGEPEEPEEPETTGEPEEPEEPETPDTPDMPNIFTSMVLESCPVLTGVLQEHFQGFPEGKFTDKIDMTDIDKDAKEFIARIFKLSKLLTKKQVARDAARNLAEYILEKRAMCSTTKLQKALLYIYMKNLEFLTSHKEGSLLHGLMNAVKDIQLPEGTKTNMLRTLIFSLNKIMYGDLMQQEEMGEFREVQIFVKRFRRATFKYLRIKGGKGLFEILMSMKKKHSRVFTCTPIDKILKLHRKGSQRLRQRLERQELVAGILGHVEEALTEAFTEMLPGKDVGEVTSRLTKVIAGFIREVLNSIADYETSIATKNLDPKTTKHLLLMLDEQQKTYLLRLLTHLGFTVNQPPTSPPERRYFNDLSQRYDDDEEEEEEEEEEITRRDDEEEDEYTRKDEEEEKEEEEEITRRDEEEDEITRKDEEEEEEEITRRDEEEEEEEEEYTRKDEEEEEDEITRRDDEEEEEDEYTRKDGEEENEYNRKNGP